MKDRIPTNPNVLYAEANEFLTAVSISPAEFDLTQAMLDELNFALNGNAIQPSLPVRVTQRDNKRSELDASQSVLEGQTKQARNLFRNLRNRAAASGATDVQKEGAHVPVRKKASKTPPHIPLECIAVAHANGTAKVSWKRNGNHHGTLFDVERSDGTGAWVLEITVTAASVLVMVAPGTHTRFRVTARNSTGSSVHSNIASVY